MRLTYDPRYDSAYLRFRESTAEGMTIRVSDELAIDMAPDGTIFGIELLNANEQILTADDSALILVNEAAGKRREISLRD